MADSQKAAEDQLARKTPAISIVVPVLNEIRVIKSLVEHLLSHQNNACEIIIVDGGSHDGTLELLGQYVANDNISLVRATAGRANQMNAGARCCRGDVIVFLHADTRLPDDAMKQISRAILQGSEWGRFDVRFKEDRWLLKRVAFMMNLRSCLTGICTGDQAMFVRRDVFVMLDGFAPIMLMEDIEMSARLLGVGAPACIHESATTDARRWLNRGITRTVVQMWWLRWRYWRGAAPQRLAARYLHER
ncbi:MAG: TIGR04283 family arsenosugar biosynthesis glycosyltransferase [Gammaproteobacteria bacterium]|nr:TIGR04283 family arsenosugar biosynthesis glycosyltransferase [Gammaproteobacteria bacterium]